MNSANDLYTNGEYSARNPSFHVDDSPWKADQIMRMLAKNDIHPKTVCEVGCGAGEVLNQLYSQMGNDVTFTGYDISPQAYELAKGKAKERLNYHCADFLTADDHRYDLLLVVDLIEHVEDCFGFLRGLHGRAKYNIFNIPLDMSVRKVLFNVPMLRRRQFGHIHYFMKETAIATLTETGFQIADWSYVSMDLDTPSKSFPVALAKILLKTAKLISPEMSVRILGGHSLMVLAT
jgi:SAM-dependent methyltransferase